jgi:hypothetical protein
MATRSRPGTANSPSDTLSKSKGTRHRPAPASNRAHSARTRPAAAKSKPKASSAAKLDITSRLFDARPDRLDFRDLGYQPPLRSLDTHYPSPAFLGQAVPAYVAAELVLDQGQEGACTGFGLAAVVNYLLWTRQLVQGLVAEAVKVSPHMLYELARRYDEWEGESYEGSSCRGALKGFHKHGVCRTHYWRTDHHGAKGDMEWELDALRHPLGVYYRVNRRSVVEMQAAIQEIGAIYVSARVHDGWDRVASLAHAPTSHDEDALPGIPAASANSEWGGHAFALVGYNDRGFIVQNSWGTRWGAQGFAVLPYADWVVNGTDAWAVALGVPQSQSMTPERIAALRWPTRSGRSIGFAARSTQNPDNPVDDPWPIDKPFLHKPYQPWPTARAYEHTLVTGNNGHVIVTDLAAGINGSEAAFVQAQVDRALGFFQSQGAAQLVIYAHGGLNSQEESIERIRVLAPYFEANGIYPLFLTWRTGPLETLGHILEDKVRKLFGLDDDARARGMFDMLGDARDRSVEVVASKTAKGLWSEMRENAAAAARRGRGSDLLAQALARLKAQMGAQRLQLHLVGHSAGSIVLGHLLDRLNANQVKVAGCSLYAPACTVAFAIEKYLDKNTSVLDPRQLHLHYLTDQQEKDDDLLKLGPVTLYGKSLLYLVSRALDEVRKVPLLGMERAHDPAHFTEDQWAKGHLRHLQDWHSRFARSNLHPVPLPHIPVDREGRTAQATHGSFDNNIEVVRQTIERVTGSSLVSPIEWLTY